MPAVIGKGGGRSPPLANRRRVVATPNDSDTSSDSNIPSGEWDISRGRTLTRRPSNPYDADVLRRRGYHSIRSSFDKSFHVERRWKLVRELGSGAYGFVISAADEITGEVVAIKLVTRVLEKVQLAKRALREITLLRHFANHANITGLIDVDAITPDFTEIYLFMEPMEADLHQIIRSEQGLTNEHIQYFVYQILRGVKYLHSANVIHRDLKPGNLLVNSDCELKICDFGLARGFDQLEGDNPDFMTQYVATRWYRAPEIMLTFKSYTTAIDVWSIGCIMAELYLGRPLFKGKDYIDQLNKILDVLGTPEDTILSRITSPKARVYIKSLLPKQKQSFKQMMPKADPHAIDLIEKMLLFDPSDRITVREALKHPWLAAFHDENEEPDCPTKFDKWRKIEQLETLDEFRQAIWNEIEEYRKEVRCFTTPDYMLAESEPEVNPAGQDEKISLPPVPIVAVKEAPEPATTNIQPFPRTEELGDSALSSAPQTHKSSDEDEVFPLPRRSRLYSNDPVMSYSRRSSFIHHTASPIASALPRSRLPSSSDLAGIVEGLPFPGSNSYVFPRSRTLSITGNGAGELAARKLMRTLSTVSIYESVDGLPGGLANMGPMGLAVMEPETAAGAPTSSLPKSFAVTPDAIERGPED